MQNGEPNLPFWWDKKPEAAEDLKGDKVDIPPVCFKGCPCQGKADRLGQ